MTDRKKKKQNRKQIKKTKRWERLDNTAHLFPIIANDEMTNVYRISVMLKEEVVPELLQEALNTVLPHMPGFNMRMRRGFFWYYFEENGKPAPDVFLKTAENMGVAPVDCFVFEDSNNGVRSAYAAGMKCIGVPDVVDFPDDVKPMLFAQIECLSDAIEILKEYL